MTIKRVVAGLATLLPVLVGCSDSSTSNATTSSVSSEAPSSSVEATTTTTPGPPAPPNEPGPYKVGRATVTATSSDGKRKRTVDVWYPVDPSTTGKPSVYQTEAFPGLSYPSDVALDRVPVSSGGPFPLVIYSHGSGGLRFIASFFTEVLASHGFVVASIDHAGDTVMDLFQGRGPASTPEVISDRVTDVSLAVDDLLARSETEDDLLVGAIDPDRVGITGHSYGGLTAFTAVAGLEDVNGATAPADPRFKVIATVDATDSLLNRKLGSIDVPVLSVTGGELFEGSTTLWQYTHADPLMTVHLNGAAHNAFTDLCHYQELAKKIPDVPPAVLGFMNLAVDGACGPAGMPVDRVQELANYYTIAFLERHLVGDERFEAVLEDSPPGGDADISIDFPPLIEFPK